MGMFNNRRSHGARKKGVKRALRRGGATRVFGEALDDAHHVQLNPTQSIASFLSQVSPGCIARERYSDGSLFFTGAPTPSQCEELGITEKPGWRTELRHSRTLNLCVQPMDGEAAPELTVEEGLRIVKESCLWEDMPNIELVRVANTNQRSAHVYVQFEGQLLAQSRVNTLDAKRYEVYGKTVFVHSMQLNASFQYELAPTAVEGEEDPLVWRNPEFVGLRCVTMTMTGKAAMKPVQDTHLVDMAQDVGSLSLMTSLRRVDTKTGVHVMVQASSAEAAAELFTKMRAMRKPKVSVNRWRSREEQTDVSDRLIWSNPAAGWDLSDCEDEDCDEWTTDRFSTASEGSDPLSERLSSPSASLEDARESMSDQDRTDSDAGCESPLCTTDGCHIEYDDALLLEFFQ
eukprot:TRINITY_DN13765_c0_g1_i3.p1 TRINITY_DN13765_c0_g1~~TRINITY_DN13765_c0_g1_i3.p1  ORF type:complete len:402 (+),score=124.73 TRINITY_DN13765_c0_g1_i3:169-1374(+)